MCWISSSTTGRRSRQQTDTSTSRTLIVVAGAVANKLHNGGEAWVRLSWACGLKRLGHEVFLLEQISPDICVDAIGQPAAVHDSENLRYFRDVVSRFDGHAALITDDVSVVWGRDRPALEAMADAATLLTRSTGSRNIVT